MAESKGKQLIWYKVMETDSIPDGDIVGMVRRDRFVKGKIGWPESVFSINTPHALVHCSPSTGTSARSFLHRLKRAVKRPRKISSAKGMKSGSARSTIKNSITIINNRGNRSPDMYSVIIAPMPFFVSMLGLLSKVQWIQGQGWEFQRKIIWMDDDLRKIPTFLFSSIPSSNDYWTSSRSSATVFWRTGWTTSEAISIKGRSTVTRSCIPGWGTCKPGWSMIASP